MNSMGSALSSEKVKSIQSKFLSFQEKNWNAILFSSPIVLLILLSRISAVLQYGKIEANYT